MTNRTDRLPRVLVSPERVIRTVVGLRPFRASGFRVEAERLGDKLLVHNYGHGGCGVTLSWGTAALAADLVVESGNRGAVAVLGSGAVGLATARLLPWKSMIGATTRDADTAHRVALAEDIRRFLDRPLTPVSRGELPTPPPGAPIGEPDMDWLRRLEPLCSVWEW